MSEKQANILLAVVGLFLVVATARYILVKPKYNIGDCLIVDMGAFQNKTAKVIKLGKYSMLTVDMKGDHMRVDYSELRKTEPVDCFDWFDNIK